jgi:hypothetical protein
MKTIFRSLVSMKTGNGVSQLIAKLALLWIALLVLTFAERTLLGVKTYYFGRVAVAGFVGKEQLRRSCPCSCERLLHPCWFL